MQALGERKAELVNMETDGRGRVRLEYRIPARGLIGFTNEFMNLTRGTGLISNIFDGYELYKGEIAGRKNGVLISMDEGEIFTYALGKLDDRGRMFVKAGDPVYEGMIVGIHSRDNDLVVNATRTKQLTNFRVSGKEDAIKITPPIDLTLEYAVEFIDDDELVEITPKSIRVRKRHLKEHDRKRASAARPPEAPQDSRASAARSCSRALASGTASLRAPKNAWRSGARAAARLASTLAMGPTCCASSLVACATVASSTGAAVGSLPTVATPDATVVRRVAPVVAACCVVC